MTVRGDSAEDGGGEVGAGVSHEVAERAANYASAAVLNSPQAAADLRKMGRGSHSLTSKLNLRTFGTTSLTFKLNVTTFGTHPEVHLGHMGDKVSLS
jgi:hypothetical protein